MPFRLAQCGWGGRWRSLESCVAVNDTCTLHAAQTCDMKYKRVICFLGTNNTPRLTVVVVEELAHNLVHCRSLAPVISPANSGAHNTFIQDSMACATIAQRRVSWTSLTQNRKCSVFGKDSLHIRFHNTPAYSLDENLLKILFRHIVNDWENKHNVDVITHHIPLFKCRLFSFNKHNWVESVWFLYVSSDSLRTGFGSQTKTDAWCLIKMKKLLSTNSTFRFPPRAQMKTKNSVIDKWLKLQSSGLNKKRRHDLTISFSMSWFLRQAPFYLFVHRDTFCCLCVTCPSRESEHFKFDGVSEPPTVLKNYQNPLGTTRVI